VVSAAGSIEGAVEQYRQLLGANNLDSGPRQAGRRELNWDGVPDGLAAPNDLPPDYFRRRGAVLATPGSGVQVSAAPGNPSGAAVRFGNINPTYPAIFQTFSAPRLFSPIGSNVVELTFVVPGTDAPAVVRGFGAVYTDVDQAHTAFEYFDAGGRSLGQFATPASSGGLSFLGVAFPSAVVHRVEIQYGNAPLGPDDANGVDVAVMDDFIFGEPQPSQAGPSLAATSFGEETACSAGCICGFDDGTMCYYECCGGIGSSHCHKTSCLGIAR
jgi:hypothetical protein